MYKDVQKGTHNIHVNLFITLIVKIQGPVIQN